MVSLLYLSRLIYFGGYGWKTVQDINNYKTFTIDETSWVRMNTIAVSVTNQHEFFFKKSNFLLR